MATLGRTFSVAVLSSVLLMASPFATVATAADTSPHATRVTAPCRGGPGVIALSVEPRPEGGYHVEVAGRRMGEDTTWRVHLGMESEDGDEVNETYRPVAEDGSWTVETDMGEGDGRAFFFLDARRTDGESRRDTVCVVGNSPSRPTAGFGLCARGFDLLRLRELEDGVVVLRYGHYFTVRNTDWRLSLTVKDGPQDVRRFTFHDSTNRRGMLHTKMELTGLKDPMFGMRAVSERGATCWIKLDPSQLGPAQGGSSAAPRSLLREHRP